MLAPGILIILFALTVPAASQPVGMFSYPDTETAQNHWEPQFGSKPVRVETLADGETVVALDAEFAKANDRGCWDWVGDLDLSEAGRISFDISAENGGVAGNVGIYFGTPNGWYTKFWWWGAPDDWTPRTFRLDGWGTEGEPDGWDKVDRFRFSIWSAGAGKATYRLRNFRILPLDRAENFVKNGSFEIPGIGVAYGWGSGHWGVGDLPWAADMDLWRERWYLDHAVAKYGKSSLCLDNREDVPLLKAYSVWIKLPRNLKPSVLSAWLRSDQESLPVTMQCGGRSVKVTATGEWTQAVLPAIPRADRMTIIISPNARGKLWIDGVQLQALENPTVEFHPCESDEGFAAREAKVDWSFPQRTPEVAAGRSISGPVEPAKVIVDEHGRVLVNGKPYIQHSLGLEFVRDLPVLNFAAASGFRDVCCQIRPSVTTERLKEIFDRCAEVGLRIIPWLDGAIPREQFAQHIKTLKDHPALLCWYVYDEPSGARFAEADYRYKLARELDPDHPALINYLSSKLQDHTGDIYSTDVYPIPHGTPSGAVSAVRAMKRSAAGSNKPVWMWLQGTGYAYWMDREPSPRELSCMIYGSLIEGARGIYYFAQIPRTKQCWDEMRAACVEIDALTPALSSLEQAPEIACDEPDILCRAYRLDGETWVLAVNTTATAHDATFELENATGMLKVEFEGREVKAEAGSWADRFGPYGRHVYRLAAP